MKHLATIQSEFLKEARNWDDLSLEEQKGYLSRHPKSKRRITAQPSEQSTSTSTTKSKKVKKKKWGDLTLDEQLEYRKQHPSSKRQFTAEPDYKNIRSAFLKVKGNDVISGPYVSMSSADFEKMEKNVKDKKHLMMIRKRLVDDREGILQRTFSHRNGPLLSTFFGNDDLYIDGREDIVLGDKDIGKVGKSTYNDIAKKVNKKPYDAEMAAKAKKKKDYFKKLRLYGVEPDDAKEQRLKDLRSKKKKWLKKLKMHGVNVED